jgi:hypothetical protein
MLNDKLERQIKIKNKYFQMIIDYGFDYDGLNSVSNLKQLIDDIVEISKAGLDSNDKKVVYINNEKKYNILHEEL